MFFNLSHEQNASYPISVTLLGIVTVSKLSQFSNASRPITVTVFGIVTFVIALLPVKALSLIFVITLPLIVLGIETTEAEPL